MSELVNAKTPLGWVPAFFAEIEPFPSAVLAYHYPEVPNLGDMTLIDPAAWRGKIDLLVGGTPCQAFSVAGKRESLDDDRGNLTLRFVELVHGIDPAFVVWENVPGVLSTKDNAFGCFLAGLVGEGEPLVCRNGSWPNAGMVIGPRRTAAWRVLDAQYFGLAQRRRRVFVVSCRTGDGTNPGAVLFEPESLPRHSAPSREAGAGVAGGVEDSIGAGGTTHSLTARHDSSEDGCGRGVPLVANALDRHMGSGGPDDNAAQANHLIPVNNFGERDTATALSTKNQRLDGDTETFIVAPAVAYAFDWQKGNDVDNPRPSTMNVTEGQSPTLGSTRTPAVAFDWTQGGSATGLCPTLRVGTGLDIPSGPAVAYGTGHMTVRRLSPTECERLQGFPDGYTLIPYRNKPAADGPRYRALGNSMAVPVMNWIGQRIVKVLKARQA